jgi:hypothetical protein
MTIIYEAPIQPPATGSDKTQSLYFLFYPYSQQKKRGARAWADKSGSGFVSFEGRETEIKPLFVDPERALLKKSRKGTALEKGAWPLFLFFY